MVGWTGRGGRGEAVEEDIWSLLVLFPEAAFRNLVRSTLGGLLGFGGGGPRVNKEGKGFFFGVLGLLSSLSFS